MAAQCIFLKDTFAFHVYILLLHCLFDKKKRDGEINDGLIFFNQYVFSVLFRDTNVAYIAFANINKISVFDRRAHCSQQNCLFKLFADYSFCDS